MSNDPICKGEYDFQMRYDAAIGAHAISGLCSFVGGALHLPIVKAIVNSNLNNFGKFLATTIVAGNALECFRNGSKEFRKIAELCIGPEEQKDKPAEKETDQEEDQFDPDLHEVKNEE